MEGFWAWLKQANARAVFVCALVALVAVIAWWTWKLMTPVKVSASPPPASSPAKPERGLGLLAILEAHRAASGRRIPDSPFMLPEEMAARRSSTGAVAHAPPVAVVTAAPAAVVVAPPPPPPPAAVVTAAPAAVVVAPPPPPPPPPPKPEVVRLTYRGMLRSSDGIAMALIEDSKSSRSAFYRSGTNVVGLTIGEPEPEQLMLTLKDATQVTLKRGVARSFSEGKSAD